MVLKKLLLSILPLAFFLISCKTNPTLPSGPEFTLTVPNDFVTFGGIGSGLGTFQNDQALAVDSINGFIYVSDFNLDLVQKFDLTGKYKLEWTNGLIAPLGVAVDSSGNVFVADAGNHNDVVKFDPSGNGIAVIGTSGGGTGPDQMQSPVGLALDGKGLLYVADSGNNRVDLFNTGNYQPVTQWGGTGLGCNGNQLNHPQFIALDGNGYVYVADGNNNRVEKFDTNGNFIMHWGSCTPGSGNGQFNGPVGIAIDSDDIIYVSDVNNNRVEKFDSNGNYISQFGSSAPSAGGKLGQFNFPLGLGLDASRNLYVADSGNQRAEIIYQPNNYVGLNTIGIFPNPISADQNAEIAFQLENSLSFSIAIQDDNGVQIAQYQGNGVSGDNILIWNMTANGRPISSGVYFVVFQSGGTKVTSKLTYLP